MNIKCIQILFALFNTLFISNINGRVQDKTTTKKNMHEKYFNNKPIYESGHIRSIKCIRVIRQVGYRYERPSVSFDLPSQGAGYEVPGPSSPKQDNYPKPSTVSAPQQTDDYAYPAPIEISPQRPSSTKPETSVQSSSGLAQGYQSNSAQSVNSLMYPSVSLNIQSNSAGNPSQNSGDYSYPQPSSSQPPSVINDSPSYSYQQPTQSPSPSPSQQPHSYPQSSGSSAGPMSTPGPSYLPPLRESTPRPSPPTNSYLQPSNQNASPISSTPGPPYLPPKLAPNPSAPSPNSYQPPSSPKMVIVVQEQTQYPRTPDNTYLQPGSMQDLDVRALSKPNNSPGDKYIPPSMENPTINKPQRNDPPSATYLTQTATSQANIMISPSPMPNIDNSYLAPSPEYVSSNVPSNPSKSYIPPNSGNREISVSPMPFSPSNSYGVPVSGYGPSSVTAKIPSKPSKSYVPAQPTGFQRPATPFPTSPSVSTPASSYLPPYK